MTPNKSFKSVLAEYDRFYSKGIFDKAKKILLDLDRAVLTNEELIKFDSYLGFVEYELGNYEISETYLDKSINAIDDDKEAYLFYGAIITRSVLYIRTSRIEKGIQNLNNMLEKVKALNFTDHLGMIYNWIGNGNWLSGRLTEALKYHNSSLLIQQKRNDTKNIAKSMNNVGIIYRTQGRLKKSINLYNDAIALKFDNTITLSYLHSNRGITLFELGNFKKALQDQFIAFRLRVKSGVNFLVADSLFNTIRIACNLKDTSLMKTTYEKFNQLPDNIKNIVSLKEMSKAYLVMDESVDSAFELWKSALSNDSLEFGYKIICQEEIIQININNWIQNKDKLDNVNIHIDEFEKLAIENNMYSSIIKIHIVRSLIFKHIFEFDKAEACLKYAISLSSKHNLPYHEKLAKHELNNLDKASNRFTEIYHKSQSQSEHKIIGNSVKNEIDSIQIYLNRLQQVLSDMYES